MWKGQRKEWTPEETETFLDEVILRKDIIQSKCSTAEINQARNQAWKEIMDVVRTKNPDAAVKSVADAKKKHNNMMTEAKKHIKLYHDSLQPGCGSVHKLRPLHRKILEHFSVSPTKHTSVKKLLTKKDTWTEKETIALLENYILRKDIISGGYKNHSISKEDRRNAWDEICTMVHLESPGTNVRSVNDVKKKWNNLMTAANREIQAFSQSLSGGGPPYVMKPIYSIIYEKIFRGNHSNAAGGSIPVTDNFDMDVNADIQYSNDDSTASIDEDSFSTIANDNLSVSYAESLNVAETDYEGKAAGTSGYSVDKRPFPPSKSHSEPRGYNYSQRVSINRELESRLKLLLTTMKCRRELGQPLKKEDIPDDLLQHLYNGKANGTLY